jgi:hypothetical protein
MNARRLDTACVLPDELVKAKPFDSLRQLREKYRSPGTEVLIFLAPIPSCRNAGVLLERSYTGLAAARPQVMDAADYMADSRYIHLAPGAAAHATSNLVEAVRPLLNSIAPHGLRVSAAPAGAPAERLAVPIDAQVLGAR